MTTDTAPLLPPPTIPDSDLEPLLGDREPVCELLVPSSGAIDHWLDCNEPAVWVIRTGGAECGHHRAGVSVLACDPCLRDVLDGPPGSRLQCSGPGCSYAVYIEQVIRL